VVRSEKELNNAAAEWPASRLVELWNSFAGTTRFTDSKPVKKFENRDKAVTRIWATIQRLGTAVAPKPSLEAETAPETKKGSKTKATKGAKPMPKAKTAKGKKAAAGTARARTRRRSSRCSSVRAARRWTRS
jgi:hypothetical protein